MKSHFPNEENKPTTSDQKWAQFLHRQKTEPNRKPLDQLPRPTRNGADEFGDDQINANELTDDRVDDHEIHSMLQQLQRCNRDGEEFADRVLTASNSNSSETAKNGNNKLRTRKPLPVLSPNQPDDLIDEDVETNLVRHLESDNIANSPQGDLSTYLGRTQFLSTKMIAVCACLMLGLLIGALVILNQPASRVSDNPDDPASDVPTKNVETPKDNRVDLRPNKLDLVESKDKEDDSEADSGSDETPPANELLAIESGSTESDDMPTEKIEATDKLDDLLNGNQGQLAILPEENVPAEVVQNLKEDVNVGPEERILPEGEKGDLRLAFTLPPFGMGSFSINNQEFKNALFHENARELLDCIAKEAKRRIKYVGSYLSEPLNGYIRVNEKEFVFTDTKQMELSINEALAELDRIVDVSQLDDASSKSFAQHNTLKAQVFEQLVKAQGRDLRTLEDDIFDAYGLLPTNDELKMVAIAVMITERVLHGNVDVELVANNGAAPNAIAQMPKADLNKFIETGIMKMPSVMANAGDDLMIQKLNADELKKQLYDMTVSFDLFMNVDEFHEARKFVQSQSSRKIDPRVTAIDRQLGNLNNRISRLEALTRINESNLQKLNNWKEQRQKLNEEKMLLVTVPIEPLKDILPERPDLQGLPLVMGQDCRLDRMEGTQLANVSDQVGRAISRFDGFGVRDQKQNNSMRYAFVKNKMDECCANAQNKSQALTTMDQILQIDHPRVRLEMIEKLREYKDQDAATIGKLIATRAKFDFSPQVRLSAAKALKELAPELYRSTLLDGFSYPWEVVAQHSAEALVRIGDKEAIPQLVAILDEPKPTEPFLKEGIFHKREVVAINHLKNCLLCHAPSTSLADLGRGLTAQWDQPLPRAYYESNVGAFVRADVTYLKQDFSVVQPVANPGPWPTEQRFDYVVHTRPLTNIRAKEIMDQELAKPNVRREAIVFALRELSGKRPGNDSKSTWIRIMQEMQAAGEIKTPQGVIQ